MPDKSEQFGLWNWTPIILSTSAKCLSLMLTSKCHWHKQLFSESHSFPMFLVVLLCADFMEDTQLWNWKKNSGQRSNQSYLFNIEEPRVCQCRVCTSWSDQKDSGKPQVFTVSMFFWCLSVRSNVVFNRLLKHGKY